MGEFLTTVGLTLTFACVAFAGLFVALAIPIFRGRSAKRRCACAASREAVRLYEERKRAALDAKRYRPERVDPTNFPQISPDLADLTRRAAPRLAARSEAAVSAAFLSDSAPGSSSQ